MTACFVIGFLATQASGATGSPQRPLEFNPSQARESAASPRVAPVQNSGAAHTSAPAALAAAPECKSARKAVKFYAGRIAFWRSKMGAPSGIPPQGSLRGCPQYLAHVLQRKAYAAHKAFTRWLEHEWHWQAWLPAKFYRVARCETGVRWDWDSGTYVSAFGIIRVAYQWYHHWTGHNTPREQYEVAAAIQRRFGWSAWGCGSA